MRFTDNLLTGTLIKRYKRFFVDVKVNNQIITAHCPNSGSMLSLLDKNNKIWISKSNNPKRKLKFTLELIKVKDSLVGVNTIFANKIVSFADPLIKVRVMPIFVCPGSRNNCQRMSNKFFKKNQ